MTKTYNKKIISPFRQGPSRKSKKQKLAKKTLPKEGTAHSLLSVMPYGHHCAQSLRKDLKPKISCPKLQLSK